MTQKQLADSYWNTFMSDSGRVVLENLRAVYGRRSSYAPDRSDGIAIALEGAFREGQRSVLVMIENMLQTAKSGKPPLVKRAAEEIESDA